MSSPVIKPLVSWCCQTLWPCGRDFILISWTYFPLGAKINIFENRQRNQRIPATASSRSILQLGVHEQAQGLARTPLSRKQAKQWSDGTQQYRSAQCIFQVEQQATVVKYFVVQEWGHKVTLSCSGFWLEHSERAQTWTGKASQRPRKQEERHTEVLGTRSSGHDCQVPSST